MAFLKKGGSGREAKIWVLRLHHYVFKFKLHISHLTKKVTFGKTEAIVQGNRLDIKKLDKEKGCYE